MLDGSVTDLVEAQSLGLNQVIISSACSSAKCIIIRHNSYSMIQYLMYLFDLE